MATKTMLGTDENGETAWMDEQTGGEANELGWDELAGRQRALNEENEIRRNQQLFDGYAGIEAAARTRAAEMNRERAITGSWMMMDAYRNGGMSDRALGSSLSQAFGRPVYGGALVNLGRGLGTGFAIYGAVKGQDGKPEFGIVGLMDTQAMLKTLAAAKLGDRTVPLQRKLYGELAAKYTPRQLESMGISNPSAPISTGETVVSAAGMRALRGEPRQPSRVSWFGSDGKGGISRGAVDRKTGEDWTEDAGTRSPDYQGRWKVLESNADGTRYENDQTGEVVEVPKGGNLRDVVRGATERERVAQMRMQAEQSDRTENARQFDAKLAAEREAKREQMRSQFVGNTVQNIAKMLKDSGVEDDKLGEMVQTQLSSMLEQYDRAMGAGGPGGSPAPQGGGDPLAGDTSGGGANGSGGKGGVAEKEKLLEKLKAEKARRDKTRQEKAEPTQQPQTQAAAPAAKDENESKPETPEPNADGNVPETYEEWLASESKAGRKSTYNDYLKWLNGKNKKRK